MKEFCKRYFDKRCNLQEVQFHLGIFFRVRMFIRFSSDVDVEACNIMKKETLEQVFSCEFCEISKNTCFTEPVLQLLSFSNKIQQTLSKYKTIKSEILEALSDDDRVIKNMENSHGNRN